MSSASLSLVKNLLLDTRDGDWGKSESEDGSLPYYVIRATDFAATSVGDVSSVPLRYLPTHTVERRTLQADDILLETAGGSRGRPTGRTMLVSQRVLDSFDGPVTCASFARFLRPDPTRVNPRYLYWFLQSLYLSGQIEQFQVQHTGIARFQYTSFASVQLVPLPSMSEQQAIAEVLGVLDDKIAANTKIRAIAMDLLLASYTRLILEAPTNVVTVETVVHRLVQSRKLAKMDICDKGDFPVFDQSENGLLGYASGMGYLEASEVEPVLYFGDHTCKLRISTERFAVGPNTVPFVGNGVPSLVLFCALQGVQVLEEYKRHWQDLMKKKVSLPHADVSAAFATRFSGILELWRHVGLENTTLVATRDALLPQLMSGKVRVRNAEKVLEGVL
jgi:type I restriction enzyme S subunit